jgi:hypothetical protein
MNLSHWIRRAVSACVLTALVSTSSMIALAGSGRVAAELTVLGGPANGDKVVFVNGDPAKSGRSVFSSTTVSTPDETSAVLSIAKAGRLQLDPNSSINLVFDDKTVDVELTSGRLTTSGSLGTVNVRTNDGKTTVLQAGESITASGQSNPGRQTGGGSDDWWIWATVAGVAAAVIIIAVVASGDDDDDQVVSPNR